MFQPIGGMDQIPKAFQTRLGDKITLGAEITSIRQGTGDVKVAFKNVKTGAMSEVAADYCVSCLPLSIVSRLDVDLASETMAAVKATPYSPSAKMGLQMKRRFWEEDDRIFGGHLYSNLPFGNFSYPSTGFFGDKGVLLGFYGSGQMAGAIDMTVPKRIDHVLTQASKVHPQIRAEYESAYCTFWERVPYSMGAFAGGGGASNANRLAVLGAPDNRIYLGCAAVSGNGAWLEGAIGAAWKQVKQLHERVMTVGQSAQRSTADSFKLARA